MPTFEALLYYTMSYGQPERERESERDRERERETGRHFVVLYRLFTYCFFITGHMVAQTVEALCYKPQGQGFNACCMGLTA
jgi:hypothetical protein